MTDYKLVPVKQIREVISVLEKFANDTFRGRNAARELRELLRPAADGEEIMVSVGYDVYTLPLHPTGLTSGPRFVVHVPGPERPTAVDEAMVERCTDAAIASSQHYRSESIRDSWRRLVRDVLTVALSKGNK